MEGDAMRLFDSALRAHVEYEQAWWTQSRRGRWVVLEPGPGRLLKGSPRHLRDLVNATTERRGRRFRSLSAARAFAHEIGGKVRRWRRQMPGRGRWRFTTNPWERAACIARVGLYVLPERIADFGSPIDSSKTGARYREA
jgi:hypothetical protein